MPLQVVELSALRRQGCALGVELARLSGDSFLLRRQRAAECLELFRRFRLLGGSCTPRRKRHQSERHEIADDNAARCVAARAEAALGSHVGADPAGAVRDGADKASHFRATWVNRAT